MIFIALAKNVHIKGSVSVMIWGIVIQTITAPTKEAKNNSQYKPVDFLEVSILEKIWAKITGILGIKKIYERKFDRDAWDLRPGCLGLNWDTWDLDPDAWDNWNILDLNSAKLSKITLTEDLREAPINHELIPNNPIKSQASRYEFPIISLNLKHPGKHPGINSQQSH